MKKIETSKISNVAVRSFVEKYWDTCPTVFMYMAVLVCPKAESFALPDPNSLKERALLFNINGLVERFRGAGVSQEKIDSVISFLCAQYPAVRYVKSRETKT